MKPKSLTTILILLSITLGFSLPASAEHVLSPPQIANGRVVWAANEVTDVAEPGEIYLYDIASRVLERLTDNAVDDSSPRIDEEKIAWVQTDEAGNSTWMIYYFATGETTQAPENFVWIASPQVDGDLTVVSREDGEDRDIVIQSAILNTDQPLTENEVLDTYPSISGNNIAWVRGEGDDAEIFLRSESGGGVERQITDNAYEDSFSQIEGDYLVWQGRVDGDWEILVYNVGTEQDPVQISRNIYDDMSPQTDGQYIAWLGYAHTGGEIFLYDISSGKTTQVTIEGGAVDCGSGSDLADAIFAMQMLSGVAPVSVCYSSDHNRDDRITLADVLYILQGIASIR